MADKTANRPSVGTPDAERLRLPGEFIEACNVLAMKSCQLAALTTAITGEGFEHFSCMSGNSQHDLLSIASDLAYEIKAASRVINGDSEVINHD